MKKYVVLVGMLALLAGGVGCARPWEIGWSPAYTARERHHMIARNWDYDGKQLIDDFDSALLLRPSSRLTLWNVR